MTIKYRIAAAKAAQRQAERDRYATADRSQWRKPATQDPDRYAEQVDRLRRTGNDWATINRGVAERAQERLDAADSRKERKRERAIINTANSNAEALETAARLRKTTLDDVQDSLNRVQRERERINISIDSLSGVQGDAKALDASADYRQWQADRLSKRLDDLSAEHDRLADDYAYVARRDSKKLTGNDYAAWVREQERRAKAAESMYGVSYTARDDAQMYSGAAQNALKGREDEYHAKTIADAEQIRQTGAYKQWAQEHGASIGDALHATATQAEYAANRGSYGTDGAVADTIGTLVGGHVGKVAGKAIAGEYADMAQDAAYQRLRDAAMMRTYLRETKGKKAADEYWYAVRGTELAQAAQKGAQSAQEYAQAAPGMASVSSVVGQLESIAPNLIGMGKAALGTTFEGFAPTYYDSTLAGQREVGTIRGTVVDSIDSPVGKWLYSSGMSLADNAVRAALSAVGVPAWVTSLMASGTAAGSSMQSALDKGVSADKALALGAVSAVAEYATEHMGIDAWYDAIKTGGKTAVRRILMAALKDAPAEGTEETISEAVNMLAEAAVLGDASDLRQAVEAYKAQGYTDAGAMAAAIGSRLGEAFAGGALAGAVLGGGGATYQNLSFPDIGKYGLQSDNDAYRQAAEEVYASGAGSNPMNQALLRSLSDVAAGDAASRQSLVQQTGGKLSDADAKAYVAALQSGDSETADRIAKAAGITDSHLAAAADAGNRAMSTRTGIRGELADERKQDLLTEAVYKTVSGQALTRRESRAMSKSTAASAVADKYRKLAASGGDIEPAQNRDTITKIASESKISTDGKTSVTVDDGTAPINIDSVRISDGQVQVVTDDGSTYDPADVTYADDVQAYTVAWASQMGADATHAYQTISALPRTGGADPLVMTKQFTAAYEWAHYYGAVGASQQRAMDSSLTQALPEEQRLRAYKAGRILADTKLQQEIKTAAERKRATYKGVDTSKVSDKTMSNLTADQTYTLAVADLLSKAGKVNIVVTEVMDKGYNGGYQASTNTIMLNINAFKAGNSTGVRWTLAHELTHFAKAWAPAEWDAYKNAMLKVLEDKGSDIARLTEHYKRLYAKHGQQISDADALEEVVCQGAQEMLENSKYIEQLAQEDKTLSQRILDALKKILEAVNRLVTGKNPDPTALAVQSEVQSLVDQWDSALKAALERSAGAGTEVTAQEDAEAMAQELSDQEAFDDSAVAIKNQIRPPADVRQRPWKEFYDTMSPEAQTTFDFFKGFYDAVRVRKNGKLVNLSSVFLEASAWNEKVKKDPYYKEAAEKAVAYLKAFGEAHSEYAKVQNLMHLNDDGTITETPMEKQFRMSKSLAQRLVDSLPLEPLQKQTIPGGDGTEYDYVLYDCAAANDAGRDEMYAGVSFGDLPRYHRYSVGGEAYRQAVCRYTRQRYRDGKLKSVKISSLSKDIWGSLGFAAGNTKTGGSGDFTTVCPQMYFNGGCFYCYRREALETGVNNKLVAEKVWYTGEILRMTATDISAMNAAGGLRIQSFGDWMPHFTAMLADVLYDAQIRGLQVKIITKEPDMVRTVAELRKTVIPANMGYKKSSEPSILGANLYFNISADYTVEPAPAVATVNVNEKRPFIRQNVDYLPALVEAMDKNYPKWREGLTNENDRDSVIAALDATKPNKEAAKRYKTALLKILGRLPDDTLLDNIENKTRYVVDETAKSEQFLWKRALSVSEAYRLKQMYDFVYIRIVATREDEFIRGLKDDRVDVVTGYHGKLREMARVDVETGEAHVIVEALGDAGMPMFKFDADGKLVRDADGKGEYANTGVLREGKSAVQKRLGERIREEGLEWAYTVKSCCITGKCAECKGVCGKFGRTQAQTLAFNNATNADEESLKYWGGVYEQNLNRVVEDITAENLSAHAYGDTYDSDTKYQITPAEDEAYMAAVNSGDMETAQRLVDQAAKKAGYNIKGYHGTNADFTVFDRNRQGKGVDKFGAGFYLASNRDVSEAYGQHIYDTYIRLQKPVNILYRTNGNESLNDVRITAAQSLKILKRHPMLRDTEQSPLKDLFPEFKDVGIKDYMLRDMAKQYNTLGLLDKKAFRGYSNELHEAVRDTLGYDGVSVYLESDQFIDERNDYYYVAWFPSQIKSADPVTYDDSGNVIPLSQRFNTDSDDIRWQLAPTDSLGLTAEELLASVDPESIRAKNTKALLTEYQGLRGRYEDVVKAAGGNRNHAEVKRMRTRMNEILTSEPMQKLEERVRATIARNASSYALATGAWYAAEQRTADAEYYGKKIDELTQKYRDMLVSQRERKNEQILKESIRASILKQVKTMHKLLMTDSKEKHVPQNMKNAVARVLEVFAADAKLVKAQDVGELAYLYQQIQAETGDDALYNPRIEEAISKVQKALYSKKFTDLTVEELQELRDAVKAIVARINGENTMFEMFGDNSKLTLQESWDKAMFDTERVPRRRLQSNAFRKAESLIKTGNMKPVYFFRMLGGEMERLFQTVLDGQAVAARDMFDDHGFVEQMQDKYHYGEWGAFSKGYKKDLFEYETPSGDKLTLTREQAMYLYATAKREKQNERRGDSHLSQGGWVYADEYDRQRKKGEKKKNLRPDLKGHPMSDEDVKAVTEWLTTEQKAYADAMVEYLSSTVGGRGNEVSMALYNIKIFGEKYYFPYRVSEDSKSLKPGEYGSKVQNVNLLTAKGFTHQVAQNASAPVVVGDFTDAVSDHMTQMATYHGEAIPQLNLWRVLNYKNKEHTNGRSLKTAIREAYGENAMKYIDLLLADLNGQIVKDPREELGALVNYKYIQTAAKISVVLQQPTAIIRAMAYVPPKYFVAKPISNKAYEELLRYSGTAVIKSIGGFDLRTGRGAADWIANKPKDAADRLNTLAEEADKRAWTLLWGAVKAETKAKTGLAEGSEELLHAAGKRFDEVVELTQVYDSVLTRSQVMRSKNAFVNMVTAYMAEPTVTLNMVLDLVTSKSKLKPKKGAVLLSVAMSIIATNLLKSLWQAAGDDDEERTYAEKLASTFVGNVAGDFFVLNYIPILKDIVSLVQGYDVERMDMAPIADLVDSLKKLYDGVFTKDVTPAEMVTLSVNATANIANILGVPATNILRDVRTVVNAGKQITSGSKSDETTDLTTMAKDALSEITIGFYDSSSTGEYDRLYRKIKQGKTAEYEAHRKGMIEYEARKLRANGVSEKQAQKRAEAKVDSKMKQMIRKDYEANRFTLKEAGDLLKKYGIEDDSDDIYFTGREWEYEQDSDDQYSRYGELYAAMDAGKNVKAFVKELTSHGYKEEDVLSSMKSHIGSLYREGELTRKQVEQKLSKYVGEDEHEIFWSLDRWDYTIAHNGDSDGYSKYLRWVEAVRTGKNLRETIRFYGEHDVDKKALASAITREFKEEYLELKEKGKASTLKGHLLNAYARLYGADFDRAKKSKDIDNWQISEEEED